MTSSALRGEWTQDWVRLPHAEAGNRIGLFGGSFNPPHSGHLLVAETALKRLELDQVWWLVTPGNPLKDHAELAPLEDRIHMTKALACHPKMKVSAHELVLGSPYTARTVEMLRVKRPALRFVWIMGADNLSGFHQWQDWKSIVRSVPVVVVNRPGASLSVIGSPMAKAFEWARLDEADAMLLPNMKPPAWTFLHARLDETSSTGLRENRIT
ncbi:nicotinate-nucleotide adenylyltransferase [Roseibium sp.]|uniref:nicotinate-nucleotide adenylyltransferase n=1 Tax=Roseibium sp. TaxID=1936156 RepID=UPI003A975780